MSHDERLMRVCIANAKRWLGPCASDADLAFTALLMFGFAAGLWSEINPTLH